MAAAALLAGLAAAAPARADADPFRWSEATVAQAHQALDSGRLTCTRLVQGYLDRIAAYDRRGPALQSVIAVSEDALQQAAVLDALPRHDRGRLHCTPLLLKDNIDAEGLPTTAGATALSATRPPDDAFVVRRLRDAGAVVLGKANLDEFAFGFQGSSSVGGQVKNAYDPTRGPGGSSSGTGASVAASLAMAGLGSDTGGSIRVPSSVGGLVGIRPSMRLLSQDGVVPLAHFQDTVGPMCRTVRDCALLLEVMAGHDSASGSGQYTLPQQRDDTGVPLPDAAAYAALVGSTDYTSALAPQGLRGARIGVVRALFGSDREVLATMEAAIAAMRSAGATVEDVVVPDLAQVTSYASVSQWEFRDHLTEYLSSWPSTGDGHPRSFEQVALSGGYEPARAPFFGLYGVRGATRGVDPDYAENTEERPGFVRSRLLAALDGPSADARHDALLYPSVTSLPAVGGPPSTGSNNRLSPFSGFPALSMPAGFTAATNDRPALPVGMELLGREFDEVTLLRLAHGYEQAVAGTPLARQAPTTTPELAPGAAPGGPVLPLQRAPQRTLTELLGN